MQVGREDDTGSGGDTRQPGSLFGSFPPPRKEGGSYPILVVTLSWPSGHFPTPRVPQAFKEAAFTFKLKQEVGQGQDAAADHGHSAHKARVDQDEVALQGL